MYRGTLNQVVNFMTMSMLRRKTLSLHLILYDDIFYVPQHHPSTIKATYTTSYHQFCWFNIQTVSYRVSYIYDTDYIIYPACRRCDCNLEFFSIDSGYFCNPIFLKLGLWLEINKCMKLISYRWAAVTLYGNCC